MSYKVILTTLCVALAGCSNLPSSGPTSVQITAAADQENTSGYEVIDVDAQVVDVLGKVHALGLAGHLSNSRPGAAQKIGIGDTVVVSLFEAASGGLFSAAPTAGGTSGGAKQLILPPQVVDRDGRIDVPYAGRITAHGRTPAGVSRAIEAALEGKAIQPQAIVTLQNSASQSVTVVGDVTGGGRIPLNLKGDRLLEVIAQAGGVKSPPHETFVRVTRGSGSGVVRMATLLGNPNENIFLYPNDTIYVYREPQSFTALGAVTAQSSVTIDRENLSLSDAVGKAGGLIDATADTAAVFLFRWERASIVRSLRPQSHLLNANEPVPVVYRISFADARGFLQANRMTVRNRDILYVANAPVVQFTKFVQVLRGVASTVRSIQAVDPNY